MAKVYGYWWGGHSYSRDFYDEHLETWESIADAKRALQSRYNSNGHWRQTFNYADGRSESVYVPTVGLESYIELYLYDPREGNNGPDRRIYFGPRGGVRVLVQS